MDLDFFIIYIVLAVLGVIGTIVFWGAIAAVIYKVLKSSSSGAGGGMGPVVNPEAAFLQQLQQLEILIRQAQAAQLQSGDTRARGTVLPPELQNKFQADLLRMQNEMRQFDALSHQRHEMSVSGMLSDASAAGLDVSNWETSNW